MLNRTTLLLAIVWAASGCADDSPDSEGGGGAGGAGNQSASTQTHGSSQTVTSTNTGTQTSTTSASSTTGTGMGCDSLADCTECKDCVVNDVGQCAESYFECLGTAGDCSNGVPECCSALMCREACSVDPANYWACMCGSADQASCDPATAPVGTCAGDYPAGFPLLYGPEGVFTCVETNCPTTCGDVDP
ncbi:MAG: hypothetical protein HOV80_03500 [Polyangiaceae bacterium]|nr:hypothetical protein [Polyangiaceae bacterium]